MHKATQEVSHSAHCVFVVNQVNPSIPLGDIRLIETSTLFDFHWHSGLVLLDKVAISSSVIVAAIIFYNQQAVKSLLMRARLYLGEKYINKISW